MGNVRRGLDLWRTRIVLKFLFFLLIRDVLVLKCCTVQFLRELCLVVYGEKRRNSVGWPKALYGNEQPQAC